MKRLLFSFLIISNLAAMAQNGITWIPAINVATGYSNMHPRIMLNVNGDPLVLWGNMTSKKAYFSRWNGAAFTTPVALNPASIPVFTASWAGPDFASKGDTIYAVFKETPEDSLHHIYIVRSFDGGTTFSMPVRVDSYVSDSLTRFPCVAVDSAGNPLVGFMKFNPDWSMARWVVAKSTDNGNSFLPDTKASGFSGGNVCDCCPGTILSSGSYSTMLFRDNFKNLREMWAGISTDGGTSFNTGMNIDYRNWNIAACPSSGPDGVIIGDSLYSVFMSVDSGTSFVYFSRSSISNAQGGAGNRITAGIPGLSVQNFPRIANAGNAVAIAWKQTVNSVNQAAVYFTNNISDGFPLNYDVVGSGSVTNTDVAVANGKVYVIWEDDNTGTVKFRKGTYMPTTVQNDASTAAINIAPNPSDGTFQLFVKDKAAETSVKIFNALGEEIFAKQILSGAFTESITIHQPAGIYFLQIKNGKNICSETLIIK